MLFTDLGADTAAEGAIKGAIYTDNPNARVDALANTVPAFDVTAGAYILVEAASTYPPDTVFLCMVAPDTHADQRIIAMETTNGLRFVSPDNGLLTIVADRFGVKSVHACINPAADERTHVNLGREMLAPVAARWARGDSIDSFGPAIESYSKIDPARSTVRDGSISGMVLWIDSYGNAVINVSRDDLIGAQLLPTTDRIDVNIGRMTYNARAVSTYEEASDEPYALRVPKTGFAELFIYMGDLSTKYDVHAGDKVYIDAKGN